MIVREEKKNLSNCLESVRGLFDEIVIVDTGSVDRTKEIAREFGAKVFDFVWIDDFAAARNEALYSGVIRNSRQNREMWTVSGCFPVQGPLSALQACSMIWSSRGNRGEI